MNRPHKLSLASFSAAIAALYVSACAAAKLDLKISITAPDALAISTTDQHVILNFTHSIDGYLTNCEKNIILIWGKPLDLNPSSPQESTLTIINTNSLKIHKEVHFSKGIYTAEFLSSRPEAIVWTDMGVAIDLRAGKALPPPNQFDFDSANFPRESCPDFPFKSFKKYPEQD
jgi:hypothetical protein